MTVLLIILVGLIGALFSDFTKNLLHDQMSSKALDLAHSVAKNPLIRQGIEQGDSRSVQDFAESLRVTVGAEYIVVGDRNEIRLSHPNPQRIGQRFLGGDLGPALNEGQAYVSSAIGSLGPSLRGIVPVRDAQEQIIGFVAVGYLTSDMDLMVRRQQMEILGYILVVLLFGLVGAAVISSGLKAAIMGLEVYEIAALFHERNAIISAIREGIIAINGAGTITYANRAAYAYLGMDQQTSFHGLPLDDVHSCSELRQIVKNREQQLDREMILANRVMVVNILPLEDPRTGMVISFRPKDELDRLAQELTHMHAYSELLRSQTHEYSNKMHTIAGLIQLEAYQEALDLVINEASGYENLVRSLVCAVPDPVIAGLILGKYNRACELKVSLAFDPQNSFSDVPSQVNRESLVTIIGNLLDNAFDAARDQQGHPARVSLYLTDLGPDLVIEVEDSGSGVAESIARTLFQRGVTTKSGRGRGVGLVLVKQAVEQLGGEIIFGAGELGGALFTVIIPKVHQQEKANDPRNPHSHRR